MSISEGELKSLLDAAESLAIAERRVRFPPPRSPVPACRYLDNFDQDERHYRQGQMIELMEQVDIEGLFLHSVGVFLRQGLCCRVWIDGE